MVYERFHTVHNKSPKVGKVDRYNRMHKFSISFSIIYWPEKVYFNFLIPAPYTEPLTNRMFIGPFLDK